MMLLIKCIAAGAIVGGALLGGRTYKSDLSGREAALCGLEQGLRFLEGRIALSEKMLSDVMKECSEKFFSGKESRGGDIFGIFASKLAQGEDIVLSWRESVDMLGKNDIGEEAADCLRRLETAFTLSDIERYSESLIAAADEIKSIREKAAEKCKKDGGIAVKLCLGAAAVAVLVLW